MSKVLIYSGTTEGKNMAYRLAKKGIHCDVCVATEYGRQVMEESPCIEVRVGRLNTEDMRKLYEENDYIAVIDATHPFATDVTKNIIESVECTDIPYYRLERDITLSGSDTTRLFSTNEECIEALHATEGRIFLTTGAKELPMYCKCADIKERLVVRVLPGMESIKACIDNGLKGNQIIAMQGPFSREMNEAVINQYNIAVMVTKESGTTGGLNTKITAASECGIPLFMIRKPDNGSLVCNRTYTVEEICDDILYKAFGGNKVTGQKESVNPCQTEDKTECNIQVTLAGIGMGNTSGMTGDVRNAINEADYVFGAKRMLDTVSDNKKKYPYYRKEDIVPKLKEIRNTSQGKVKAIVLFSGDTGFYSGCVGLYECLCHMENVTCDIFPGISSIQALCARIGESWQDANIISIHGDDSDWRGKLIKSVKCNRKTFLITSGYEDIIRIGKCFENNTSIRIWIGSNLSYENEVVGVYTPLTCKDYNEKGLVSVMIINDNAGSVTLTPDIKDECFIRDKVPMTKEEIRQLSICKLGLTKDSVMYDIGSGTGSMAIQAAMLSPDIRVYAVETNDLAVNLIENNIRKFDAYNVTVVKGMAPDSIRELPSPTNVFIGGSKGNLKSIIDNLIERNVTIRVVMNAVSIESISEMNSIIKENEFEDVSIAQVAVSRVKQVGDYRMLSANNPVFVYSFTISEERG